MTIGTDKPPQSWKGMRLGNVCKVVNGSGFKTSYQGYDSLPIPFIKVSDMNMAGNEKIVSRAANTVNTNMLKELKAKTCPAGSVIFPKVGGAVFTNKKRLLGTEAAFDNNIMGVVPLGVSSEWLFYWFQTVDLSTLANISALPWIKTSVIKDLEILIPSLPEQKRIAGILNQQMAYVEKARQAAEEILEAAQALPGAFLRQIFPAHGDALPAGWKWTQLGDVLASMQPGFACGKRDEKGVAQLRMNNISTDGRFNWDKIVRIPPNYTNMFKYWLEPGDVLFNNTNSVELVGKSAIFLGFHEKIVYSNHVNRLRPDTNVLDTSYLANWLLYNWTQGLFARMCNRWVGQAAVPRRTLLALTIPLPPLPEQKRIAALLKEQMAYVQTVCVSAREQLDAIHALPAALLRKAFAGDL